MGVCDVATSGTSMKKGGWLCGGCESVVCGIFGWEGVCDIMYVV